MHIISRKKLREFWLRHPDSEDQLAAWFKVVKLAHWARWADVVRAYPRASYYRCCLVFNMGGGNYRLVVRRSLNWKTLFVVAVMTHAEYNRGAWKKFCSCR
jgi:mRNA interferase HigB